MEASALPPHAFGSRTAVRTDSDQSEWNSDGEPAMLQPRFHLRDMPQRRCLLHAAFRRVCILTTPFFVGITGFRSKLWMVDPETGDFAGLYEWDNADEAREYAEGPARVLRALSVRGSVDYELVPNQSVEGISRSEQALACAALRLHKQASPLCRR